jgi:hypothetical protein
MAHKSNDVQSALSFGNEGVALLLCFCAVYIGHKITRFKCWCFRRTVYIGNDGGDDAGLQIASCVIDGTDGVVSDPFGQLFAADRL